MKKLLLRIRRVLVEVHCQSTGCYADTGHQPACIRGRAERLIDEIDQHLRQLETGL